MGLMRGGACAGSPGEPDPAMNVQLRADAVVSSVAAEPGGKILMGGDFWWVNGAPSAGLARLNTNGTVDGSFAPQVGLTLTPGGISSWNHRGGVTVPPTTLLPLPDGRLWVSASSLDNSWTVMDSQGVEMLGALAQLPAGPMTRTHAEGVAGGELVISLYTGVSDLTPATGEIRGIDLATGAARWSHAPAGPAQPQRAWPTGDGSWWVAGDDPSVPAGSLAGVPGTAKQLWRITSNGQPDATWAPVHLEQGFSQTFQPLTGGRLAALAIDYRSYQYDVATTGTLPVLTTLFGASGAAESTFWSVHSTANPLVAQAAGPGLLLSTLDSEPPVVRAFEENGEVTPEFATVPLPPGNALVALPGGGFFAGAGRHFENGLPDPSWMRPSVRRPATVSSIAPAPNRALYVSGDGAEANGMDVRSVLRVGPDGLVDGGFRLDPMISGEVRQIQSLADGRLYVLDGHATWPGRERRSRVVRVLATGALDTEFAPYDGTEPAPGVPGGRTFVGEVGEIAVFADGSLLVRTFKIGDFGLSAHTWRRLTASGEKDPEFNVISNPPPQAPVVLEDGKFWLQGQRYLRDGTKDFALPAVVSSLAPPALLSDGRVAFKISQSGVRAVFPSGAWDTSYFIPLPSGNAVHLMSPDQKGGLILAYDTPGSAVRIIERYDRLGRRDPSFRASVPTLRFAPSTAASHTIGPAGRLPVETDSPAHVAGALAHGGGLWLGGQFTHCEGQRRDGLVRLEFDRAAGFEAWATACFRLTPTPPEQQAAEDDPDGDGAVNALEYATGTDPSSPDAGVGELRLVSTDPVCYSVVRNRDASDMLPVVETSANLQNWRAATAVEVVLKEDSDAVTFQVLGGATETYFRVRFVGPP